MCTAKVPVLSPPKHPLAWHKDKKSVVPNLQCLQKPCLTHSRDCSGTGMITSKNREHVVWHMLGCLFVDKHLALHVLLSTMHGLVTAGITAIGKKAYNAVRNAYLRKLHKPLLAVLSAEVVVQMVEEGGVWKGAQVLAEHQGRAGSAAC